MRKSILSLDDFGKFILKKTYKCFNLSLLSKAKGGQISVKIFLWKSQKKIQIPSIHQPFIFTITFSKWIAWISLIFPFFIHWIVTVCARIIFFWLRKFSYWWNYVIWKIYWNCLLFQHIFFCRLWIHYGGYCGLLIAFLRDEGIGMDCK